MKLLNLIAFVICTVAVISCQPAAESTPDPGVEAFKRNSETVMKIIEGWENESPDYSLYADDYFSPPTGFGDTDTVRIDRMKEMDADMFKAMDFEVAVDAINLLPGVDVETKKIDGSVRWYSQWKLTRTATDSTEAKSALFSMYQVWTFNEEGKVAMDLGYGDFGGLWDYLWEEPGNNADSTED